MSFESGNRLGSYQIVARIGSGGMGEVYRARDSRLNRDVARWTLDGRFLRIQPMYAEGTITLIEVVLNWLAGVGARKP